MPKVLQFLTTVPQNRFQFEVGIQSTNPETLKAINREYILENKIESKTVFEKAKNAFKNYNLNLKISNLIIRNYY